MIEWQPIETAPKDGTDVLVWDGRAVQLAQAYEENGVVCWWNSSEQCKIDGSFLRWQPLPAPPKEDKS